MVYACIYVTVLRRCISYVLIWDMYVFYPNCWCYAAFCCFECIPLKNLRCDVKNHQNQNRHFVCMPLKPKHWSSCCFSFGNRQVLVSADNPPSGPGEGGKAPRPETTCSSGDTGQATLWGARKRLRELNGCLFRMSVGQSCCELYMKIIIDLYHIIYIIDIFYIWVYTIIKYNHLS